MSITKRKNSPSTGPLQLQPGSVRPRSHSLKNSQAHPGVSPLSAVGHRNTSFQPLPRPLGLAPYHYSLTDNFPAIGANIDAAEKMVFHVLGDSGGVQDAEFQNKCCRTNGGAGVSRRKCGSSVLLSRVRHETAYG